MEKDNKQTSKQESSNSEVIKKIGSLEATVADLTESVHEFADNTEKRFNKIESEMTGLKSEMTGLKSEMTGLKSEMTGLKSDVTYLKNNMVTKDYLDDKLVDLKGDLNIMMRKEDKKLLTLVDILHNYQVISDEDVKKISSLEPFPQD